MALTTFQAIGASFPVGAGDHASDKELLGFKVVLAGRDRWELTSGDKLEDVDGGVSVVRASSVAGVNQPTIGAMHFFERYDDDFVPSPASYIAEVILPDKDYDKLWEAAKLGRLPEITLDIEGMEYGSMPDGTDKKWDNVAKKDLPVKSASFHVPLVIAPALDPQERTQAEHLMPATRLQMDQFATLMMGATNRIFWALVVIATFIMLIHLKVL